MATINIHSTEAEASADFENFVRDWKAPESFDQVPDAFVEEELYLKDRGANIKLSDPNIIDLTDANEHSSLESSIDWQEAQQIGLHLPSGNVAKPSGDAYYNPLGNGARHLSTLGAMILSGGSEG